MTKDKRIQEHDLALPEVASPRALDEKILAYARTNTPQSPRATKPAWMSGLAAASIVGIAVMITLPEEHSPAHIPQPRVVTESAPGESDSSEETRLFAAIPKATPLMDVSSGAESNKLEVSSAEVAVHPSKAQSISKPETSQDILLDADTVEMNGKALATTAPAEPAVAQAQTSRETQARQVAKFEERTRGDQEQAGSNSLALEEVVETASRNETPRWHSGQSTALEEQVVTSSKREEQISLALEEVAITATKKDTPQSIAAAAPPDILLQQQQRQQLQKQLGQGFETFQECLQLWRKERHTEATDCYAPLLENCQDCGLPETVDEAAETFYFIGSSTPDKPE